VQRVVSAPVEKTIGRPVEKSVLAKNQNGHRLSYGSSLAQNSLIRVTDVHDLGITGKGVRVGMLDTGFNYKNQSALRHLSILGEYDFIFDDDVTSNQSGDPLSEDDHGTETLSVIGGFSEGALIGPLSRPRSPWPKRNGNPPRRASRKTTGWPDWSGWSIPCMFRSYPARSGTTRSMTGRDTPIRT